LTGGISLKKLVVLGLVLTTLVLWSSAVLAGEVGKNSWGVGIGIPYGIMGVNVDCNVMPYMDLSVGLGTNLVDDFAYNLGAKVYLASPEKHFRPRLSCYYGINTVVTDEDCFGIETDSTNYKGVSLGIGANVSWGQTGRHGLDFDLIYIASTEADIDQLKAEGYDTSGLDGIKISLGYRRRF
jgi:hypothetical protein